VARDFASDTTEARFLALICADKANQKTFEQHLVAHGFELHAYLSLEEFLSAPRPGIYYSGLVIDSLTQIKFTSSERESYRKALEGRLPVLELTLKPGLLDAPTLKLIHHKWNVFIKQCESFDPRGVRSHPRIPWILRVEICASNQWNNEHVVKTVTGDISAGGCFVIAAEDIPKGQDILIRLLPMSNPIPCRVAWNRPWGASKTKLPGLGLEFLELSHDVKSEIEKMILASQLE
jgi:hypothetical protein